MFDAILLLAGKGERSGLEYNKVLFKLNDKPLFLYSLETFLKCRDCRKMILVCREEEIQAIQTLLSGYQKIDYAIGGEQRQDSVKAGIARTESDIALIHDGARPFVKKEEIEEVYEQTVKKQAAVLVTPVIDTIVEVNSTYRPLNRDSLWKVMTPQGVWVSLYQKALKAAEKDGYYATDDVSLLVKYLEVSPAIVRGSADNIKVTNASDLEYLKFLYRRKG